MVEKDDVRRGYDDLAETYAERRAREGPSIEILDRFLDSVPPDARVLDAGCGQGTPVLRRIRAVGAGVGLDFSREQLLLAAENAPRAALAQGDMTRLPFADDAFDAVVAYWSLIHVPLADHQAVLDEFARVLRPDGRVLVSEGTEEWRGENPDWLDAGVEMQWHMAGPAATREQLWSAGFEVVDAWGPRDSLPGEAASSEGVDQDDENAWTFFVGRLDA